MSLGKYLTNTSVIGAAVAALGTAKQTRNMPKDWRQIVVWGVWAAGFALALAGAAKQAEDEAFELAKKDAAQQEKQQAKRSKQQRRAKAR